MSADIESILEVKLVLQRGNEAVLIEIDPYDLRLCVLFGRYDEQHIAEDVALDSLVGQ